MQTGPANLLYRTSPGYTATMTCYPFDDLAHWRGIYPVATFIQQFERTAQGWAAGLDPMRRAVQSAEGDGARRAREDLGIAEAAQAIFASVAEQARFIVARDALVKNPADAAARSAALKSLENEIVLAKRLYPLARADSRIGFEAANHYFFVPLDLAEKVLSCEYLQRHFAQP
jgi:hypothetical protein